MIASTKKKEKKISADPKVHFKMYKGGKLWLVSGLSMLSVTGTLMASKAVTVHADTTSSTNGGTQAVASGGNAVSKTNASYTQVNVDSSALTSAVSAAKSAGVNVSSASGSSYTVQGSAQLSSAEATVKSDYASQTQALQSAAAIAQNSNAVSSAVTSANAAVTSAASAYQAAGGQVANPSYTSVSAQTSSAASSQVASIKAAASSTVAVLSNATETKKAVNSGNNAIQSAANAAADVPGLQLTSASNQKVDTASEASSVASDQVKAINDAIATQKKNNADYQAAYAKWAKGLNNPSQTVNPVDLQQNLFLGIEKNATISIKFNGATKEGSYIMSGDYYDPDDGQHYSGETLQKGAWFNEDVHGVFATVTETNLSHSYYTDPQTGTKQMIGKIVYEFSDLKILSGMVPNDGNTAYWSFSSMLGVNSVGVQSSTLTNLTFYDENGQIINYTPGTAWLMVTSLSSAYTDNYTHVEHAKVGGANQIFQVNTTVNNGGPFATIHNGNDAYADVTDAVPASDPRSIDSGMAVIRLAPGGTITYYFNQIGTQGSTDSILIWDGNKLGGNGWNQYTFSTVLLKTSDTHMPKQKTSDVSYHYLVSRNDGSYLKYTLYKNDSTGASVSYHTDTIYYTQTGEKQSTETVGGAVTTIDGKQVVKGDTVNYTISTDNLPANRTTDTTNVTFTDTLPTGVALKDSKIMLGNQDVTSWFTKSVSGQTVTYTLTNADVLKQINSTKSTAFTMPKMVISGVVTLDGATLKNTAHVLLNNANVSTNTTTSTSGTTTPTKRATVDNDSASADNKYVVPGDTINYTVNWDLTGLPKSTVVSDSIVAKGLSLTDNYDGQTTADQRSLTVVDANGNVVSGISTSWDANNHVLKITANNPRQFIATYGGQKLQVKFNATVNKNLKDGSVISNTAIQNNFGSDYKTNTVTEKVQNPDPTKDVVKNAGSTVSIDGKTVPFGSNVSWKLNSTTLKAGRATVMTSWGATDVLDLSHVTPTGNWKVYTNTAITIDGTKYVAGSDVSQYFVYTYDAKTGTAKLAANAKYLAAVNASKDTAQSWSGYIQTTATKAGWATNTFDETLNTNDTKSNEVKTFTYDPVIPDPNKDATIGKNDGSATTSINGKQVTKGDTIAYELKGQTLKQYHDTIESFADTDVFDKGVTYIGYIAYMQNADGTKTDVTSHMKEQVNGDTVKWVADDTLLKMMNSDTYNTKASVTPTVVAYAVVNTDEATKIDNTYNLLINGKTDVSNIVEVTPTKDTPSKSETVAGNDSNGKTVIANDTINYDVTWDLSGLDMSKTAISNTQLAKGISLTDSMTATEGTIGFVSAKNLVLKTADGKTVDPNLYTVSGPSTIDFNGLSMMTVKIQAKDAKTFLNTYGGQKLHLMYAVTVKDGKSGDIENKAVQSDFGNTYNTNVVKNVITDINPTKDVVVNAGETTSINGNTVDKESTYNYKLNSSVLPANRATIVGTWSATDKLDLAHVTPTGNWKVYTDTDFVAADGSTVKAGTDISEYFTYNYTNGTVTMTPKASYLQVMNSAANRATKQSWSGYVQVKVTAAGWATNTFDEDLNNVTDKSNEVKTFSFDPVIPDPNKDATIGKNDGSATTSINGKQVTKGDTIAYELKGQTLKQYHDTIESFADTDVFDKGVTYIGYIAYMQNADGTKTDVTSHMKEQVNGDTVKWVADDTLLKMMNSDTYNTKASVTPTVVAYAVVNTDEATKIDNTYNLLINGKTDVSNIVEVTPTKDTPSKSETVAGNDSNNKTVIANDTINYDVTWDLSGLDMSKTAISNTQLAKGISLTDSMTATEGTIGFVSAKNLVLKTADGKTVDPNLYTVSGPSMIDFNGLSMMTVKIQAKDAKTFLNTYGGQKLHLTYAVTVKDGKSGNIVNQAVQSDFGNIYSTNVVKNVITDINPTKDVVVNAGETTSINGKTVDKESTYNYKLNSSVLPANRATIVGTWSATDKLDLAHVTPTGNWKVYTDTDFVAADGSTVKAGTDISEYFTYNYTNGTVTMTPKASYLQVMNSAANRATKQSWSGYVQVKVTAAGWATNTFDEDLNNITDKSNEVKTFSFDPVIPDANKDVTIGKNDGSDTVSINGKQVTKGDTVSFELKGQPLVQYHEKINDFAAVDIFDKGVTYVGYIAYMQNANGTKTDVTSHIKEQVDGNTVKYVADDYLKSLMNSDAYNTKASVTPTIIAYATVNTDQATKIDNTYTLNINGKTDVSNIVEVTPTKDTPSKSETVAGNDSNNKTVIANDTINYDVTWDLSGLDMSKTAISSQQLAKGISLTDTMTATDGTLTGNVTAKGLVLKTAAGKTVDANLYTVSGPTSTTKNGITTTTFTIKAKDAKTFLNTYGGQKLHLTYAVTVKDGKSGNIANQAVQSDFGNIYSTNVVKNVITDINPTKDVVVNAGETKSIDGSTVAKESTYNYKLNSSVLPANRATIVGTWTATDKLDTAHVAATGNWKVYTDTDFVDASGNTVKAGTDISKYFSFNNNNGTVTFTPNADYKALMNSTANRNTKQQWSGYVQVKVIAAGWATNTFDEDLNNITDKSNEVKTFSFDPVIPDPNKDVKIGETNDSKAGSVNGKQVTKGDTVSFELKGQPLVQYHETVKTFNVKDTLDDGLEYEGYTASMMVNGKQTDVTAHLKLQQTGNVVEFTADDYLKSLMNSDAYNTKASETPTIYLYAKVAKDDVTIDNTYTLNINGKTDVSNIVEVTTKGSNPSKTVNIDDTTTDGNGKVVLANDKLAYTVTWDLSNLNPKNLAISSTQLAKGLSLTDTLTYSNGAVTAPTAKDFSLVDANGKAVDSSLYKLVVGQATTKDGVTTLPITVTATDANKFLQSFGGQKLQLKYNLTVLKDKTGSVKNSASQNNFGQSYDTKVVTNTVENPQPSKDVVKDAGSTVSIDGQTVGMGDTINYVLKSRTLPANRGTVVGDWSVSDVLSKKVQATGQWKAVTQYDLTLADGSVLKAGSDISKYFTVSFNNGTVVATPTAEFLKIANLQANQAKQLQWKIYVPTKVVASGWATNQFNEDMNKVTEDSNEVKTFTFEPVTPEPNKDVNLGEESTSDAANATSINGDLVTVGDTLTYQLKGQTLPQYHDQIKTFSATDTFDSAVSYLGYKAFMTDENGKQVDVTDYLTATVDGNKVTWTAKDALLKLMNSDEYNTKASDTPTIFAYVKVNKSASKIANKYTLDINGKTDISNEVDNNTPEDPTPTKHNTVDGIQIDGKTVAAGTTSDYLINWDLDQYKGAVASTNQINRGFYVVDDYPDDVLTPDLSKFTVKAGNTTITGVSAKEYSSLADAPLALQLALKEKGITPSGKFIVFSADDPASFFKNYVQTGTNLTIDLPATVKATTAAKTSYTNTAYQSDFGNVSTQATVTNQTPDNPTPTKVDDNEAGVDINGKTVLPGSTNVYKLTLDYDQYKGMAASDDIVANGFYMIEDYPEEALDVDTSKFTMQDANGKAVTGLSAKVYQSVSDAPAAVQAVIKANNLKINGAFIVFSADNPAQFFKDYVQTGDSITIAAPMTVKDTATDGESYSNVAYQVDFGKAFETNVVTNNVTKPNPKKDVVLSVDNNKSLDNSNISLNQSFDYELEGADLPEGLGTPLTQYGFVDDYDQVHDQYNGQYLVMAKRDIYLTDGTVLKKGTDLTKYTTQTIDTENGKVDIEFSKDFLAKVDFTKGGFKADAYVSMTRVKAGDVTNQYTNVINGKDYLSNTVKTHTDEPKQPETPTTPTTPETPATPETPQSTTPEVPQSTTPATPQSATPAAETPTTPVATPTPVSAPAAKVESPATPAQKQASLPQTGNDDKAKGAMLLGLGGLLMSFGLLGSKKKKAN